MNYMNAKIFIDTNILVCAFDSNEKDKQEIAQNLLADEGSTGEITLSTQVLQEFFVTVTRKLKEPLSIDDASKTIQLFNVYPIIQITPRLILKAIERHQYESFSFWDALLSGAQVLFSEDMQDGRQMGKLKISNPFSQLNKSDNIR
ncbi:PIN domain-containing protein [Methyloprofundus sp.]|uniref:PIN domain-containing protein n=1 Tax=Methyloprofundus sp. TaxID=2020875 RepID=UPI003D11B946